MNSMIEIVSRSNLRVKDFCRRAKNSCREDFLLEGRFFVRDIPPENITDLLLTDREQDQAIANAVLSAGGRVSVVSSAVMEKICGTDSVQQVAAFVRKSETERPDRLLLLDRLQDPGNAGTIIRSASAFGFGVIFGANCVNPYGSKTVRSSAGTVCSCYVETGDLFSFIPQFRSPGRPVFSAEADRTAEPLPQVSFPGSFAVVIGNEGRGVSPEISSLCDKKILIPISENTESLNAAVAASIIMYTGRRL